MKPGPDVVVIGGGVNGLTAAASLARRGRQVLLIERRDGLGGTAASESFHPGHHSVGLHHDTTGVRPWIVEDLALERHGLLRAQTAADIVALDDGEGPLTLPGDTRRAAESIASVSGRDAEAFERLGEFIDRVRHAVVPFLDEPPLDWLRPERMGWRRALREGLRLRRLGRRDARELMRIAPMPVGDWLLEQFETDRLAAALALPALIGTNMGPRSPGSCSNLLLLLCAAGGSIEGGGPALVRSLETAARAHGVEFRTGLAAARVLTDAEGVAGVELADGERITSRVVAASCHPQHLLLELLAPGMLSSRLERRLVHYRTHGRTALVLLASNRPLRWSTGTALEFARTGSGLDDLERAHDAVKYRSMSATPILDLHVVGSAGSTHDAPSGGTTISALVHFVPYALERGWSEAARADLVENVIRVLERHTSALREALVGQAVLAPPDIETRLGIPGGHLYHGELSLDQLLVRPAPECHGYRTPVPGLWLCGSGSHPGIGLSCASGALAAAAIVHAR